MRPSASPSAFHALAHQSLASFIVRAGSLGASLLILRSIPAADYGAWKGLFAIQQLALGLLLAPQAALLFEASAASDPVRANRGARALEAYQRLFGVSVCVLPILAGLGFWVSPSALPLLAVAVLITLPAAGLRQMAVAHSSLTGAFAKQVVWQSVETLVFLVALATGRYVFHQSALLTLAWSTALAQWIPLVLALPFVWRGRASAPGYADLWALLGEKLSWSTALELLKTAFSSVRIWCMQALFSNTFVGTLAMAENLIAQLTSLFTTSGLTSTVLPRLGTSSQEFIRQAQKSSRILTLLYSTMGALSILPVYVLLTAFFPLYAPAFPLFLILLGSVLVQGAVGPLGSLLFHLHLHKQAAFLFAARVGGFGVILGIAALSHTPLLLAVEVVIGSALFHVIARHMVAKRAYPALPSISTFLIPMREDIETLWRAGTLLLHRAGLIK